MKKKTKQQPLKTVAARRRPSPALSSKPGPGDKSGGPTPDLKVARRTVLDLLAVPGISGQERDVAEVIRRKLLAAGCPPKAISFDKANTKTPLKGNCGNLIVKLPGTLLGPRRLLMAHLDTVPVCEGTKPVLKGDVVRSGNPATGLGADDRAGCAVVLTTALEILRQQLDHPPLTLLFAIQEEVGLWGARMVKAADLGRPRLAFNFDGGAVDKLTIGATGGERLDITVEGIPSHAGVAPEQGVSAIAIAAAAIASLTDEGWHGLVEKGGKRGTSNIGVIHAGSATNVVAERADIRAEARGHDPAFRGRIVKAIEKAFASAAKRVKSAAGRTGTVSITSRLDYEAFRLGEDEPSVVAAREALESLGHTVRFDISNGGLDANWMAANGIPTVTLGCGQNDIHTTKEWLDLPTYESACQIALRLAAGAA